jgi:hypothetical protein
VSNGKAATTSAGKPVLTVPTTSPRAVSVCSGGRGLGRLGALTIQDEMQQTKCCVWRKP